MLFADVRESDLAFLADDEGGRISGFFRGIPAKAVGFGEAVIGIEDEEKILILPSFIILPSEAMGLF